jgi:hypothetical protein
LWVGRVAAVLLCGLHAWVARHVMNPDGMSYLDVADAYARGDLLSAVNSYWSPLYSWLLAGARTLLQPSPYWECGVAHAVNFAVLLAALLAFEWLLAELLRTRRSAEEGRRGTLPEWALVGLSYALFIWTSRRLITVSYVTPDMCVAALVYLSAALLLRIRRLGPTLGTSALLGIVLGTAYLAKAILFPLSFVFLVALGLATGAWRKAAKHVALSALCFLLVAGGFLGLLSARMGHPTFGDSGALNYAWYVGRVPCPHWTGGTGGTAANPVRRLHQSPAVYEFDDPVDGTYPLWYDPPYWYQGVHTSLSLTSQLAASAKAGISYLKLFCGELGCFTGVVLVLYLLPRSAGADRRSVGVIPYYLLLLPAFAAMGLYLLVGHVEGRLIGPFLLLLLVSLLAGAGAPERAAKRVAVVGLGVAVLALAVNLGYDARNTWRSLLGQEETKAHPDWEVARNLHESGLGRGERVACIGDTFSAYWARLGGYRLVAEVPEKESVKFWKAGAPVQHQVLATLHRAGARAVVAGPVSKTPVGWVRVPGTAYIVHRE